MSTTSSRHAADTGSAGTPFDRAEPFEDEPHGERHLLAGNRDGLDARERAMHAEEPESHHEGGGALRGGLRARVGTVGPRGPPCDSSLP